jgi:hypothetical protein
MNESISSSTYCCHFLFVSVLDFASLLRTSGFHAYHRSRPDEKSAQAPILDGADETGAHDTLRESRQRLGLGAQGDAAYSDGTTKPRRNGTRLVFVYLIMLHLEVALSL